MLIHCACLVVERLWGAEASLYASDHLTRMMTDPARRALLYRCPDTGALWRLGYAGHAAEEDAAVVELAKIDREAARDQFGPE